MRHSPVLAVDPADLDAEDRERLETAVDHAERTGTLDLDSLPQPIREQLAFAMDALRRGESVAAVADGKPLTSTEAAKLLGMSRSHLARLCEAGSIENFTIGNALRVPASEVMRILNERATAKAEARDAAATAEQRRRDRAARAAGIV